MCAKFGLQDQFIMPKLERVRATSGSCIAKDLLLLWREQSVVVSEFINGLACKVGGGDCVRFWEDIWIGDMSLQIRFPRVFALCLNKEVAVAEVGSRLGGKWEWKLEFRRRFFDWEVEQYQSFLNLINSFVSSGTYDLLFWKGDAMGMFSVKGLCCALEDKWFQEAGWVVSRPIRKMVPAKVTTFMWQLQKNRVATKANLLDRGISLPDSGCCSLCFTNIETASHLFLHCNSVWAAWCAILCKEGVSWAVPKAMNELLLEWRELRSISDVVVWDMIPYALVWSVWLERNGVVFNNKEFCVNTMWDMHIARLTWWLKAWWSSCPYSAVQLAMGLQHIALPKPAKIRKAQQWVPPEE